MYCPYHAKNTHIPRKKMTQEEIKREVIALEDMGHMVYIVCPNIDNHKFVYDKANKIIRLPGFKTGIPQIRLTQIYSRKAMKIIKEGTFMDLTL